MHGVAGEFAIHVKCATRFSAIPAAGMEMLLCVRPIKVLVLRGAKPNFVKCRRLAAGCCCIGAQVGKLLHSRIHQF